MKNKKQIIIFIGILLGNLLFSAFIFNSLSPIHYVPQNIFILELIGKTVNIPLGLLIILNTSNIFLLWLISKQLFTGRLSLIPSIIYAFSPWSNYLVIGGSFYIYLSFLLQLICYGLLLIKSNQKFWGSVLLIVATTTSFYSSFLLFFILPVILILLVLFKIIPFTDLKIPFISLIVLMLPLLFIIHNNKLGFRNILDNEIRIFQDPGLLNMVNSYQGAASQRGFGQLARLSENRYIFFSEYILLKFTKQFVPSTIFTPQEKLLNFSFSPPIYLGFLIPFVFGLYRMLKTSRLRKALFLSTLLVIPSVLAKSMVDLNRLFIFMPVIILVTVFGLILLYEQRNKKKIAIFLALTISLVILQVIVTISDIQVREKDRFIRYYGQNYEIGKQ